MWHLFGKLLHPCAVQLVKTSLLSSKRGHFDLVYCSVLKPRSRNSWHHWPCISTFAAAGCTSCSSCLAEPTGEWTPQHGQDGGSSICTHNAHTGPSWNAPVFWSFLQESKGKHGTLDYKSIPSPAWSLSTQKTGFLFHLCHIGKNSCPELHQRSGLTSICM